MENGVSLWWAVCSFEILHPYAEIHCRSIQNFAAGLHEDVLPQLTAFSCFKQFEEGSVSITKQDGVGVPATKVDKIRKIICCTIAVILLEDCQVTVDGMVDMLHISHSSAFSFSALSLENEMCLYKMDAEIAKTWSEADASRGVSRSSVSGSGTRWGLQLYQWWVPVPVPVMRVCFTTTISKVNRWAQSEKQPHCLC